MSFRAWPVGATKTMATSFGIPWLKPSNPTLTSVIGPAVPLTVMLDGYGLAIPAVGMMIGVSLL